MASLPILPAHAIEAARLPLIHRDPFDRMLAAQSRLEQLAIVTNDCARQALRSRDRMVSPTAGTMHYLSSVIPARLSNDTVRSQPAASALR
jgi:hypothetical protein